VEAPYRWGIARCRSGRAPINTRRPRHDRIEVGLLEHGVSLHHPHARPSGDLAEGADIAALQEPDSEVVPPVVDPEPSDASLPACGLVRLGERVATPVRTVADRGHAPAGPP
jgi:hypothetical protein